MWMLKCSIVLLAIFANFVNCEKVLKDNSDNLIESEVELSKYLQKIEDTPSIPLISDVVVLQKIKSVLGEERNWNEDILERCARFLSSRELKIKLPDSEARDLLAGARSKKIRRVILPLLLFLKLKAAIILPIILSIIALVSFKGFGLSLAALAVAGTTALKNILENVGSKVSYEVVPTPVGHWSRTGAIDSSVSTGYQYQ